MRRSTIIIISILAMLLLAGSLMGFTATIYVNTRGPGLAVIEIDDGTQVIHTIPPMGYKTLDPNSNNVEYVYNLDENTVYTATIVAFRNLPWTLLTNTDSQTITSENPTITLNVDLYWDGVSIPDDPPAGS
ncbi:MAG: hypothetical protein P9L95_00110 [Candidatus Tenebribacter mawsonii]|nr:hypothetical protein [Candidatus Tenebribacter mawsonii]